MKTIQLKDLTEKDIRKIVRIESKVYPEHMQYMQGIKTKTDLEDYCEDDQVSVLLGVDWYLIMSEEEVVDLATTSALSLKEILSISACLKEHFGIGVKFSLDARESTSYKIISFYEKRGKITVYEDMVWSWGGEIMHEMVLSFN